jgi:ribosomal protein S18 acetylase RimI-like enzyme
VIEIRDAEFPRDLAELRALLREYVASLEIDLDFQDFEGEFGTLPGKYARPAGRLLVAWSGAQAVGCIALRAINGRDCEMKRLYVRPQARGEHLGRRLAERICEEAREAGYGRICLDTLSTMTRAQSLYRSMGFVPIEPYTFDPVPGSRFFALDL